MRLALVLMLVVACGKKGPDCGAYAAKFSDTVDAAPERRASVFAAAQHDCENHRVDDKMFQCVMNASTSDDVRRCQGLGPASP